MVIAEDVQVLNTKFSDGHRQWYDFFPKQFVPDEIISQLAIEENLQRANFSVMNPYSSGLYNLITRITSNMNNATKTLVLQQQQQKNPFHLGEDPIPLKSYWVTH